jgi:hypothetical protein
MPVERVAGSAWNGWPDAHGFNGRIIVVHALSPGPRAVRRPYVSRILRLTLLAPEIVEAILDGRQPAELQLDDLVEGFPLEWEGQRLHFG